MVDITGPNDTEKKLIRGGPLDDPKLAKITSKLDIEPTIMEEAQQLIYGDRQAEYGNAKDNFTDIGDLWSVVLGFPVGPEQVALCMIQLKVARAKNDLRVRGVIGRDTKVDIVGYAGCIEKIEKGV